jgi:hypothetical protein
MHLENITKVRWEIETYIIILPTLENFHKKYQYLAQGEFCDVGYIEVIIQITVVMDFLLLVKFKNMPLTLDHHTLKHHNT